MLIAQLPPDSQRATWSHSPSVAAAAPADLPPAPADLPPAPEDLAPPVDVHEASTVAYTKKLWQAIVGQNISGNDALDALAQPAVFA